MKYESAVGFLKAGGFQFKDPDFIELAGYDIDQKTKLNACTDAISEFIGTLGGSVDNPHKFDPFKSGVSSTTGDRP
jgi:hypothetical protein